jgi:ABC-2 type transport system ATP-binding protein
MSDNGAPDRTSGPMDDAISIRQLSKRYDSGFEALKHIDLDIRRGEIFALLGPNGAGKTTLISCVCGIVRPTSGTIIVDGHDAATAYRHTRAEIGLVPQELTTDAFETVWNTVTFSRGLFGRPRSDEHIRRTLESLSLLDKRDERIMNLSGGMKRRLLIAKALSHEPSILFLDEPTAGVDVELRQEMWKIVRELRRAGVTIILTTHYIEEAEEMADRVGVINHGELILVEEKTELMHKLGKKQMSLELTEQLHAIPDALSGYQLDLTDDGNVLIYTYDTHGARTGITPLLQELSEAGIRFRDIHTTQSTLEDIFVSLVKAPQ